jgi:lipoate-protein ligase A
MVSARLIDDPPQSGSWNMAVDQALLHTARDLQQPTLRFYRWTPATLSLGYFQAADHRREHPASRGCDLVRRATGGGAIVHDRELTYSLCIPCPNAKARANVELYRCVHRAVIEALAQKNIPATLYHAENTERRSSSFLCFQRRAEGDVVVAGHKICGSAQRRDHAAILQHGSILLAQSEYAPQLPGLRELSGIDVKESELSAVVVHAVERLLGWTFRPAKLSEREQFASLESQQKQFGQHDWNYCR